MTGACIQRGCRNQPTIIVTGGTPDGGGPMRSVGACPRHREHAHAWVEKAGPVTERPYPQQHDPPTAPTEQPALF